MVDIHPSESFLAAGKGAFEGWEMPIIIGNIVVVGIDDDFRALMNSMEIAYHLPAIMVVRNGFGEFAGDLQLAINVQVGAIRLSPSSRRLLITGDYE